ncbi:hypothetical protein MMC25_007535 [Agyrium rufum]|nr:hypothetical protein [Agyrium rufum]
MSDVRDYLLTVERDKEGALAIAQTSATKLSNKEITLIDIVQSLGEYINDEDATIRSRAVRYLSDVIGCLPPNFLTRQQIQVLNQFLCDRIQDGGAIGGLSKLANLPRFNKEMAVMTFRALIQDFQDLQLRPQTQRMPVYELLNTLMFKHREAIRGLGDESLVGIVDLVSSEKDPRNLMMVFSALKVIMVEWNISKHAETLFDAVFCYFPITFRPPPDDPYGITAQDLKTRLRDCIAASRSFAPFAFPQLIDKLDSTSPNVKKDVLQALTACASNYGVLTISNYSITLWDSLKYEVINVQEEDLAEEALVTLREIAVCLSSGPTESDISAPLSQYLKPVTKECNEYLQNPQQKQAKPAGQILASLATASPAAFANIGKSVLPSLLTLYHGAESIASQRAVLEVLISLLESAKTVQSIPTTSALHESPLNALKERLIEITSQALMSTPKEELSFRVTALRSMVLICSIRKFLQENEVGMVVQYLDEIILKEDYSYRDTLKNEAIQGLVEISRTRPTPVMDITFPAFMAKLPDSATQDDQEYLTVLEGLARLSVEKATSDTLIRRLLSRLDIVLKNGGSSDYPRSILQTLYYILSRRELVGDPDLGRYYDRIVTDLSRRVISASSGDSDVTALNEMSVLQTLGRLCTLIIRALDDSKQKEVANWVETILDMSKQNDNNTSGVLGRSRSILTVYLTAGLRCNAFMVQDSYIDTHLYELLTNLTNKASTESEPLIRQSILWQIALLLNKSIAQSQFSTGTDFLLKSSTGLLDDGNLSLQTIPTIFWASKALILRLAPSANEILTHLLNLLAHSTLGSAAARGFALLLAPDEMLTKENFAVIRLLSKQRVFNTCIPFIASRLQGSAASDTAVKTNYLIAASGILRHVSTTVLLDQIDLLLPLLLQSLDVTDQEVKWATIQTLAVVAHESPVAVEGHVKSLIRRLIKAAEDVAGNTPKVRLNALRCLHVFPGKIKQSTLLPLRRPVTKDLMAVLDDPKRSVRKEAVDCRAAWMALDEPNEDD